MISKWVSKKMSGDEQKYLEKEKASISNNSLQISSVESLHKLNLYYLLFLWFSYVIFFGLASFDTNQVLSSSKFVLLGGFSVSIIAFVYILFAKSVVAANTALFCAFIPLALLPKLLFHDGDDSSALIIELFYVLILATPALLNIWSWIPQFFACSFVMLSFLNIYDSISSISNFRPLFLILSVSVLSILVLYFRKNKKFYKNDKFCSYIVSQLSELSVSSLKNRFANISLGQAGLIVILLLISGLSGKSNFQNAESLLKIYALIVLIFANLFAGLLKNTYIKSLIVFCEIFVPILVILSFSNVESSSFIYLLLFSVLYTYSTLFLGWSFYNQISLCWFVILFSVFHQIFRVNDKTNFLTAFSYETFAHHRELSLLVFLVTSSILFFKVLRKASWEKAFEIVKKSQNSFESSLVSKIKTYENNITSSLEDLRNTWTLKVLFLLTLASCLLSTGLIIRNHNILWGLVSFVWIFSLLFWFLLNYFKYNIAPNNFGKLRAASAVLATVLIIFPSILIVTGDQVAYERSLWIILPIIGIGLIHWGLAELMVISSVSLVCGYEILTRANISELYSLYFLFVGILIVLVSVYRGKRSKQNYLINFIPDYISSAKNLKELAVMLADVAKSYFQNEDAFVSISSEELLLLKNNELYNLDSNLWPIRTELSGRESGAKEFESRAYELKKDYIGCKILNWLQFSKEFYHIDLGYYSTNHSLVFELSLDEIGEKEKAENLSSTLVFIPFRHPFFRSLHKPELDFVKRVLSLFELKLENFLEKKAYLKESQINQLAKEEREYELSALVHDINNTVQDLTVLCDSLNEDVEKIDDTNLETKDFSKRLDKINVIAKSMATVVSDAKRKKELDRLKDLSPKELVNVSKVLDDIVEFSKIRAERKRIDIKYGKVDSSIWIKISAREHFETIIRNVINNSIAYSEPGTVIFIEAESDNKSISIAIMDEGPGIAEDDLGKIFESGYRAGENKFSVGGLGIGLYQSRRIAESAGGLLAVYSEGLGKGSRFVLELPVHVNQENSLDESWALIVDDQTSFVEFYVKIFKSLHLNSKISNSFLSAKEILEKDGRPSFVLTDLHFGSTKGSGFELIEYIRDSFGDFVPIMVVSGLPDEDIESKVKEAGANDFISKPVGRRDLYLKLEELIKKMSVD